MLVGVPSAFLGLVIAELAGNSQTRPFTRFGFVATLLWVGGLPSATGGMVSFLAGVLL
jgi:hypothetical protein